MNDPTASVFRTTSEFRRARYSKASSAEAKRSWLPRGLKATGSHWTSQYSAGSVGSAEQLPDYPIATFPAWSPELCPAEPTYVQILTWNDRFGSSSGSKGE